MTNGNAGWILIATRTNNQNVMFAEPSYSPLLTSSGSSGRLAQVWSLSSTFTFREMRFTDSLGNYAIATFPATTTLSELNNLYSTYTSSPTTATVSSNVGGLTNFYFRAQSGANGYYSDSSDWAVMCFSVGGIGSLGDTWDLTYAFWLLAGADNSLDPMTGPNVAVGLHPTSSSSFCHWRSTCTAGFSSLVVNIWVR